MATHGGCPAGKHPSECTEGQLVWLDAAKLLDARWPFSPKPLVVGHSLQYEMPQGRPPDLRYARWPPLSLPHLIAIDTGCGFGGPLTACILPERRFLSVADET